MSTRILRHRMGLEQFSTEMSPGNNTRCSSNRSDSTQQHKTKLQPHWRGTMWSLLGKHQRFSHVEDRNQSHHRPSTIDHRPSAIDHPPSAIDHGPWTIDRRPSNVKYQISTIDHRPSTIDHRPSTIDHRPSTIDHRLDYRHLCWTFGDGSGCPLDEPVNP